jgi:hypothetical protein
MASLFDLILELSMGRIPCQKVLVATKAAKQTLSAQVTGIISAHY